MCVVKGMAMHKSGRCAGGGRARAACAAFGSGFGAGSAYTECQREVCSAPLGTYMSTCTRAVLWHTGACHMYMGDHNKEILCKQRHKHHTSMSFSLDMQIHDVLGLNVERRKESPH